MTRRAGGGVPSRVRTRVNREFGSKERVGTICATAAAARMTKRSMFGKGELGPLERERGGGREIVRGREVEEETEKRERRENRKVERLGKKRGIDTAVSVIAS